MPLIRRDEAAIRDHEHRRCNTATAASGRCSPGSATWSRSTWVIHPRVAQITSRCAW